MRICFIPIDNRPVCYNLAKDIAEIDKNLELFIPPREYLGDLTKNADIDKLFEWLENCPQCEAMILSLDTIAYGGLIPSRRSKDSFEEICSRLERLEPILKNKKVYAFSSIMRISNNNINEEEKEYWNEWGKKIFEYSYKGGGETDIPQEILEDYLSTRKRNFDINKIYLEWQKKGIFDTLIFSKDDCAVRGFNVNEAKELEKLGGKTKTGADEIPLTLLARAIKKDINVYVQYTESNFKNCVSNYEDISIEQSVLGQLELGGFKVVNTEENADIVLVVNNFIKKQGEHVMNITTQPFAKEFIPPKKPYVIADVRFANGADNKFTEQLLNKIDLDYFYGYSAWNTSANTLGSLLAGLKIRFNPEKYNENAFKKLQMIRFLDDWAYQANLRINGQTRPLEDLMNDFEQKLINVLNFTPKNKITYSYPWKRSFEIEVHCSI